MIRELFGHLTMVAPVVLALAAFGIWRRKWTPIIAATALLWISSTPFISDTLIKMIEGDFVRPSMSTVTTADAIVVLSFGAQRVPGDSGAIEFDDFDRFLGGYDLFQAGKAPLLLFTGGWSQMHLDQPVVGDALMARALSLGVPESALAVAGRATNTREEAAAVKAFLSQRAPTGATGESTQRLILVTSAWHMSRAMRAFEDAGLDVHPYPVDSRAPTSTTILSFLPSGEALADTERVLHELLGRLYYWLSG